MKILHFTEEKIKVLTHKVILRSNISRATTGISIFTGAGPHDLSFPSNSY